jgi:uncharacterized membrane protein
MQRLIKGFFQGSLIVIPILLTAGVLWFVVKAIDDLLRTPIPGLGLVIVIVFITVVGIFAGNVVGRRFFNALEDMLSRLPVVKLLYCSLRDLISAFVGEKKSFDRPVMVDLVADHGVRVLGFVTCDTFDDPQLAGMVSVYLPQSYNFAGNLLLVPQERVHAVDADGAQFMAFIVSGGVASMDAAETIYDSQVFTQGGG